MSSPSAPAATAAIASAGTSDALPAAWLGSTITGSSVRSRSTGIAERSSVLRVAVSKVRMPRSQSTTWSLPSWSTYRAAASHSSMVADMPRLTTTGRPVRAAARSSGVLCMERAPIISASTCGDQLRDVLDVERLGDDRQPGHAARLVEQREALARPCPGRPRARCAACGRSRAARTAPAPAAARAWST